MARFSAGWKAPTSAARLQQPGLGREQVVAAQAEGGLGEQPGATGATAKVLRPGAPCSLGEATRCSAQVVGEGFAQAGQASRRQLRERLGGALEEGLHMLQQAFRAGTRRLRGEQQAAPGADLAEAAEQRVAQLQLVAQAPLEGRFVQARQQAPGRLHRHLLRGQRTEQQQRRLAVHGQFAAMPSGPRRQRLQALAGSLAGHPSGIWHRGLHDQDVPARPPPVVDLRQRLAE